MACPSAGAALDTIKIRGARTHNLKNVDVDLPRDKLIVITGLSGSGKSSLAFDTLFAEGQRRYVESLSAYARQFLSVMDKPDVDLIDGLSPAISIEQKSTSHNPRSTVGTITEIHDYLRLLFARTGTPKCPTHDEPLEAQTVSQIVDTILAQPKGESYTLLAPVVQGKSGDHTKMIEQIRAQGYLRIRLNGEIVELDSEIKLNARKKHRIDVVIDRFKIRPDLALRLAESVETTLAMADGIAVLASLNGTAEDVVFSSQYACRFCGYSVPTLEPRSFSFNSPHGACGDCEGLGVRQFFDPARIVASPELSVADGAIRSWDKKNPFFFQMMKSISKHYQMDLNKPFNELSKTHQDILLYGSGDEEITFTYKSDRDKNTRKRVHPFEGVIPNLDRRYKDTESNAVREELSKLLAQRRCTTCEGVRLNEAARHVFLDGKTLPVIAACSIAEARTLICDLKLTGQRKEIADKVVTEILQRLDFLINVGLDYLSLDRGAETLSGGEAQRIRLASQIGAGLMGVMYVLDEPSIGLHQRDNDKLLGTLRYLRDLGNTVIVVEHDEEAIRTADYVIDIGPGAGRHGGQIVASGTPAAVIKNKASITGQYLSGKQSIVIPKRAVAGKQWISIAKAQGNNLRSVNAKIPVGLFTCITGVSGSGKSTLINDTLYRYAANTINKAHHKVAPVQCISGLTVFDKIVDIDQSAIGRTPRSNPATYSGLFTGIRDLFAGTREARSRGYQSGRFSFNVKGGRCEACSGDGLIKVEMHFLPDVYVPCDVCDAKRYNRETLEIRYKGKSIHDILSMTVEDACEFFAAVPALYRKLTTLMDVGLSYITLGQNATTLSGGEAQRIKLARELSKRDTGNTLYILDEPTTGLHFADVKALLSVLVRLREAGNTIIVIEHNLDVIRCADWIVDMGPEGGSGGGTVVASGTPEDIAACEESHTGYYLQRMLPN